MNSSTLRRIGAVFGAAAVVTTVSATVPATATVDEGNKYRPCFMIQCHWNYADGPQPTCPNGRFEKATSQGAGGAQPVPSGRIVDYLP